MNLNDIYTENALFLNLSDFLLDRAEFVSSNLLNAQLSHYADVCVVSSTICTIFNIFPPFIHF